MYVSNEYIYKTEVIIFCPKPAPLPGFSTLANTPIFYPVTYMNTESQSSCFIYLSIFYSLNLMSLQVLKIWPHSHIRLSCWSSTLMANSPFQNVPKISLGYSLCSKPTVSTPPTRNSTQTLITYHLLIWSFVPQHNILFDFKLPLPNTFSFVCWVQLFLMPSSRGTNTNKVQ